MTAGVLTLVPQALGVHDFVPALFELDGNVADSAAAGSGDDWSGVNATPPVGSFTARTGVLNDPAPASIFTQGGSKDDLDITNWRHKNGAVPDKDDITNAYAAAYNVNGQLVVYAGLDRFDNSGDAFAGFWFFKQNVTANPVQGGAGTFSGQHSVGDILVLANFQNGGATVSIEVLEWVGTGGDVNGTLRRLASNANARCQAGLGTHAFCGITNETAGEVPPWPYQGKGTPAGSGFPVATFFEVGINVSALFAAANQPVPCFSSFMAETRSSSSVSAQLKDFALGGFPVCRVEVSKSCPSGALNASGTAIDYVIQGQVRNAGFGTLTGIQLTDNPPVAAFQFFNCDAGGQPTGSPIGFNNSLAGNTSICYRSGFSSTTNGPSDTITVQANAAGATLTAQATANCPVVPTNPNLSVNKACTVVLDPTGSAIQLKVNINGTVCNTGDVPLTGLGISDSPTATFTQNVPATLPVGQCADYAGSYIPSTAENRLSLGTSTTLPGLARFNDTVTATAVAGAFGNQQRTATATAHCNLCPTCSPDACGLVNGVYQCAAAEPTQAGTTTLR